MANATARTRRVLGRVGAFLVGLNALLLAPLAAASDHVDGPKQYGDADADLNDVYFFLDPNDPTMAVIIGTMRGFIVPANGASQGGFSQALIYRFQIENTGGQIYDRYIHVRFTPRTSTTSTQTAILTYWDDDNVTVFFTGTGPTTTGTLDGTPQTPIVTDMGQGVSFFAGPVDDPAFVDLVALNRWKDAAIAGTPDPALLDRGRDSMAGYNTQAIAIRMPASMLRASIDTIGVDFHVFRATNGDASLPGTKKRVDRVGNPGMTLLLLPYASLDKYNLASGIEDKKGTFKPAMTSTLTALGTNTANTTSLVNLSAANGDFLRLNLTVVNEGFGGGNNPGAGFPNGRRLQDDVIDWLVERISNGVITTGDQVSASDVPINDTFPFLALPHQPREGAGNVDDNTRN